MIYMIYDGWQICWLIIILVGGIPTPLKNMTSSVGTMKFSTEWENNIHVPNHQPVMNDYDVYDGGNPLINVSKPCLILFITEVANK